MSKEKRYVDFVYERLEVLAHEWDGRAFYSNMTNNYATELRAVMRELRGDSVIRAAHAKSKLGADPEPPQ